MYQEGSGKRKLITAIVLVMTFILLINTPYFHGSPFAKLSRKAVLTTLYPFQFILAFTFSKISDGVTTVFTLWGASGENVTLKEENAMLKSRLLVMDDLVKENQKLRESFAFKSSVGYKFKLLAADIISRSPSNWFETVIINRGSSDGIKKDFPVICSEGVVGRVLEVSGRSSKVMLITDPESAIGVYDEKTGEMGLAVGGAMNSVQVKYLSAAAKVAEGDRILSSGVGEVYPKGLPVGSVTKVHVTDRDMFKYVEIRPFTDFDKVNKVFVIMD